MYEDAAEDGGFLAGGVVGRPWLLVYDRAVKPGAELQCQAEK